MHMRQHFTISWYTALITVEAIMNLLVVVEFGRYIGVSANMYYPINSTLSSLNLVICLLGLIQYH